MDPRQKDGVVNMEDTLVGRGTIEETRNKTAYDVTYKIWYKIESGRSRSLKVDRGGVVLFIRSITGLEIPRGAYRLKHVGQSHEIIYLRNDGFENWHVVDKLS
jgi:hypothetical protein